MKQAPSLAKLTKPKSANVLLRKRLFKLLDEARNKPVVWITASPGSGKTTLISSYIETRKINNLWYQVDEGDGDIASFFHYMGIAAKQAAPRFRKSLPNLTPEYFSGLPTFTRNYFRELFSRLNPSVSPLTKGGIKRGVSKGGFAIVLDNYQDVPSNSPLHEIIQTGLSEIPDGINVIIISRTDPPSAFAGLRANNRLNILGWNELKLSSEETNGIVQLKVRKKLSREIIQELHRKTNGWAAGLVLMLEHKGAAEVIQRHGSGFTTQAMFDYFAGELFQKLAPASQEILLQTAFLPLMTARLAQQLTGLRSLNTTLHRLRRLLGNDAIITLEDNRLTIDARYAWVDVFAFQRLMGKIEDRLKKTEAKDDNLNELMESILTLYQGPFLRDIEEQWALSSKERLKNRYLQILSEMANYFELSQNLQNSIRCHERCIEIDNLAEENYRRLMTVYNNLGRKAEGLAVYKRCKEALRLHLDTSPSKETETIHIGLRS